MKCNLYEGITFERENSMQSPGHFNVNDFESIIYLVKLFNPGDGLVATILEKTEKSLR